MPNPARHHHTASRSESFSQRALHFFQPAAAAVIVLILAAAAVLTIYGIARAQAGIEAGRLRRALCAEQLRGLRARNPFVEHYVLPADPCLALEVARR